MAEDLKVVAAYATPMEAGMARNRLEAAGVQAFLADDHSVGWLWHLGTALSGIKVLVAEGDSSRALEILESVQRAQPADQPSPPWSCSTCGTEIEGTLEVCWACGTTADGIVDPDFQDTNTTVVKTPGEEAATKRPPGPLLALVVVFFIAGFGTVVTAEALTGILGVELFRIIWGSAILQVLIWLLLACEFLAVIGVFQSWYYYIPPPFSEDLGEAFAETTADTTPSAEEKWDSDAIQLARTARRACLAAVLGIAFFPPLLNIYSFWLIARHQLYREAAGQKWGFLLYTAIALNAIMFAVVLLLFLACGGLFAQ